MKHKKLYSVLSTALITAAAISGCGNSEISGQSVNPADNSSGETITENSSNTSSLNSIHMDAESSANSSGGYNVTWEDMADIIIVYPTMSTIQPGLSAVEDAMNEITESEINTHVSLRMIEVGNYDQQMNLMMSSGEQVDLAITMPAGPSSFATMTSQKQLMDITNLLEEYAPRALAGVGSLIGGTQINGHTYAFPAYKSFSSGIYINMRTDVLNDLGLLEKAQNMTTLTEYGEIMEAVKASDQWKYLAGCAATDGHGAVLALNGTAGFSDNFSDTTFLDNLGDTLFTVGIRNDDDTVLNVYASEEFKKNYEIVRGWYEKGLVYKDSATTAEMGTSLVKSNIVFSYTSQIEIGAESSADTNCGMDMTSVRIAEVPITTSNLTKFTWAIPNTAKEPEAAATFLEMMFTDSRIANLFAWGIEGTDYEIDNDGIAHYIEGNETPAYHGVNFLNANKFILAPWEGEDPKLNALQEEQMKNAAASKYLGFACDTTAITDEISAINNAIEQYKAQIISGAADEATFNEFLQKLEDVGIQTVVDTYQTQLDAWLKATGK